MVEQLTVNQWVVGSNPTSGAKKYEANFRFSEKVGFSFFESDCFTPPRSCGVGLFCEPKSAGFWLANREILMLSGE